MLSTILNILWPSRKKSFRRHLKMEIFYGKHAPKPIVKPKAPPGREILPYQKSSLMKHPQFQHARIEYCSLKDEGYLVGLNKHRLLHEGVIMYPETVQESTAWASLVQQALDEQTGIGIFKLKKHCECLKITGDSTMGIMYLITKDHLTRIEWLLRPEEVMELFAK